LKFWTILTQFELFTKNKHFASKIHNFGASSAKELILVALKAYYYVLLEKNIFQVHYYGKV